MAIFDNITTEGLNNTNSLSINRNVIVTSSGTYTISSTMPSQYIFTGSTSGQIVQLPSATTLTNGVWYIIWNSSTVNLTINDNGSNTLLSLLPSNAVLINLQDNSTANGSWNFMKSSSAPGQPRYVIMAGFDGIAITNRWLEYNTNVATNASPFIIPETATIVAVSLAASANSTGTATVKINGTNSQSISLAASKKTYLKGLNISLAELDEISAQITSGSINRPMLYIFVKVS